MKRDELTGESISGELPAAGHLKGVRVNSRREAIYVALAAAEVCWAAPVFLALTRERIGLAPAPHSPLLSWLGLLALLLGFFYLYRALVAANLSLRLQQSLLVAGLLLSIGLVLRFHVYADAGLRGIDWFLQPLRSFATLTWAVPVEFIAILTLTHLWARGTHLARRSLGAGSVGFSFRSGVVILMGTALIISVFTGEDISGFVVPYFFFALVALALARIEDVSRLPNSSGVRFGGFWIGSTVGAVALLVSLGTVVAVIFHTGGLEQALSWLSPLLIVLFVFVAGLALLLLALVELVISLLPEDWNAFAEVLEGMNEGLGGLMQPFAIVPDGQEVMVPPVMGAVQATILSTIIVVMIFLVVLFTWWRTHRDQREGADESRESLLSAGALAQSLLGLLQSGRDRLGQLAGLVDVFGVGHRLLSAITIQRIYVNVVRLATSAGYPRLEAQTPYEYMETLHEAFPGQEADVELITEAYVSARYGLVPDSREELQRIRQSWERVRAQGIEKT